MLILLSLCGVISVSHSQPLIRTLLSPFLNSYEDYDWEQRSTSRRDILPLHTSRTRLLCQTGENQSVRKASTAGIRRLIVFWSSSDLYGSTYGLSYCLSSIHLTNSLDYVVQGHRFDIVEDFGCRATTYVSLASTFIIWVPPLAFSVGGSIFAG